VDEPRIGTFSASLSRCLADPGFLQRFYELFLGSSPAVAARFAETDFERQRRALGSSLYVMVMAAERSEPAVAYLERIAERHSRAQLDIEPGLYDLWLDCLLRTVRERDPQVSDEVVDAWHEAMRVGIELMRSRY